MKRIAFHLLLAAALILQGAAGAFVKTASEATHGPCCPQGAIDGQTHHAKCPCPQKQHCASDCQLMCAASGGEPIASQAFVPEFVALPLMQQQRNVDVVLPRSASPPLRPPIV